MKKLLTLLFLSVIAAAGSTIQFTGLPINTQFGTFNGFAIASIDGVANEFLICDDFIHTTYVPSGPLAYDLSSFDGPNPLQYVRFNDSRSLEQSLALYRQAGLLLDGLQHTGPNQLLDLTSDYQYALWHLFTPSVVLPTATSRTLLQDTAAEVLKAGPNELEIYSRLRIFTPEEPYAANQEFLQLVPAPVRGPGLQAPVPEPSAAVLIGCGMGLMGIAFAGRRIRRVPSGSTS